MRSSAAASLCIHEKTIGTCSDTLSEGEIITGGYLHHPGGLHDEEGVVHPRGLRVCTSSYVFDLSLSLSLVFLICHDLDVPRALLL